MFSPKSQDLPIKQKQLTAPQLSELQHRIKNNNKIRPRQFPKMGLRLATALRLVKDFTNPQILKNKGSAIKPNKPLVPR
jgi:hypothetical protein